MTLFEAIVLGIVQGLTEFLPISSTAHLEIVPVLLGWTDPGAAFSAVIQCGTLAAVLAYFRHDIARISVAWTRETFRLRFGESLDGRLGWMVILGTIPVVVCGLLFKRKIEGAWRSLYVISAALIVLALLLMVAEALVRRREKAGLPQKHLEQVGWWDSLVIGLAQAVALIPGSSRSGVTITGGLFRGLNRETAARFSFLLSLPAVFAAGIFKLLESRAELLKSQHDVVNLAACTVTSAIVGYLSIAFLLNYLKTHSTYLFIVYRLALGSFLLFLLFTGRISPQPGGETASGKTSAQAVQPAVRHSAESLEAPPQFQPRKHSDA